MISRLARRANDGRKGAQPRRDARGDHLLDACEARRWVARRAVQLDDATPHRLCGRGLLLRGDEDLERLCEQRLRRRRVDVQ